MNYDTLLKLDHITVAYGAIKALKDISLFVNEGEIVTLIGANGAGKSTTLRTISGLLKPQEGKIYFKGQDISGKKPHVIVQQGISQAPEGRGIFANLSTEDNLEMGAYSRTDKESIQRDKEMVFHLFPILQERRKQEGGTLSGGEQQMLTISRALMARPKLLLLDEPSLGLAPQIIKQIFKVIQEINQQGTTILLVEQNLKLAEAVADHVFVMVKGRTVYKAPLKTFQAEQKEVKARYLTL